MPTDSFEILWICLIVLVVLAAVAMLTAGVACLIRYAKTRKKKFLAAGLLMTLLVPGCLVLLGFLAWLPNAAIAYGPPPSHYVP
jgi:ABC-type Fe3+ transport system permease subunit